MGIKKHTNLNELLKCPKCGKSFDSKAHKKEAVPIGDYNGDGGELGDHIIDEVYGCKGREKTFYLHPFFYSSKLEGQKPDDIAEIIKSKRRSGIAAHHLICSASVIGKPDHEQKILFYGYCVNHHKNGVLLPTVMKIACHYKVPVHRGSHNFALILKDDKITEDIDFPLYDLKQELTTITYADKVNMLVDKIMETITLDNVCDPEKRKKEAEKLINKMDKQSQVIFEKVKNFKWSLSADSYDYHPVGIGCFGENTLPNKRTKVKRIAQIQSEDVIAAAQELYNDKDKIRSLNLQACDRDHYTNHLKSWPHFKERSTPYLTKKTFEE